MILLISPAKTLDFSDVAVTQHSLPRLLTQSEALVKVLKKKTVSEVRQLMSVSEKIAALNVQRFQEFRPPFSPENAKQAIFAFQGDVYTGLDAKTLVAADLDFAQQNLRILSGLYGVLRPLDLIQPYRLEMGIHLATEQGGNLYEFWGTTITDLLNADLASQPVPTVINLASNEYFKSVDRRRLKAAIYDIVFKDEKNGAYKVISFFAKKARGTMARYIIQNRITQPEDLKGFRADGYWFNEGFSTERTFVFTRG